MSLFDRYGIKEVADVTFYELDENNPTIPTHPVLYLDTLKVSTIEQTAENTDARGGKGNSALLTWDYGKEITLTLEDALFSVRSLEVMYGADSRASGVLKKTCAFAFERGVPLYCENFDEVGAPFANIALPTGLKNTGITADGKEYKGTPKLYYEGVEIDPWTNAETGTEFATKHFVSLDFADYGMTGCKGLPAGIYLFSVEISTEGMEIDVSANSFPGTYYITGDTYARNESTGKDEFFQFIIPKAKVLSESNNITLEAEGEPTVFNMSLKVLKSKNAPMMSLIQYETV